jgi:uncharacterized protein DUF4129
MTGNIKRKALGLLGLIILITMMIATSLSQLELQPGIPPPRLQHGQVVAVPIEESPFLSVSINTFVLVLIALILMGTVLYSAYKLLRGADWKSILNVLRPMLIISAALTCLIFLIMLLPVSGNAPAEIPIPTPTPKPAVTSPLGPVPAGLLWLVGIGLLVISVGVGVWIFTSSRQPSSIDLVGLEAEKAWQALKTGLDLKDVIIKCYLQMSLALKQDQGIERENFMTTGEFENLLEAAGVPHEPIHQLTRLFNAVRYGNWQPNAVDEQKAIQCLQAIMLYSRETRGTN